MKLNNLHNLPCFAKLTLSWILCDQLLTHFGLQEIVVNGVNAKKFELRGFPFT